MASLDDGEPREVYYRYYEMGSYVGVEEFRVLRRTPKGVWVDTLGYRRPKRFVLDSGRKRFCYPTLAEAWASFLKRKERQQAILAAQHDDVAKLLAKVKDKPLDEVLARGTSGFHVDTGVKGWDW